MSGLVDVRSGDQIPNWLTVQGSTLNFLEAVALGKIDGYSLIRKFGAAEAIDTNLTPIATSKTYQTPTQLTDIWIVSSSTNDTSGGTGINEMAVIGIGSGWNEITQTVVPNGQTRVKLDLPMYRVYRMYGTKTGTYASPAAASHTDYIFAYDSSAGGNLWAEIVTDDGTTFGLGQSQIGAYTVPAGKKAYFLGDHFSAETNKDVSVYRFFRDNADDVSTPYTGVMRVQDVTRGTIEAGGHMDMTFTDGFTGPCDIGYMAHTGTGAMDIEVDFLLLLQDIT